jgi:hypothetical protein
VDQTPSIGDFVEVRGRRWLVGGPTSWEAALGALRLACIDDDAQGEPLTAADRQLFQAPFRAGTRLDAYQLLPLRRALGSQE